MVIFNNTAAMSVLNENNRNAGALGKIIQKAASGMRINSAGDDAAAYSIASKMNVRLRALKQDDENVNKGESMLRLGEGAIQSQLNLLKTVKERVINAHNDTNTDADRAIIQKEIDQCYEQISTIAHYTDFNGRKILLGNELEAKVSTWTVHDTAVLAEDSDIPGLFPDLDFDTLDGEKGPFATFGKASDDVPYDGYNVKKVPPNTLKGAEANPVTGDISHFTGGTAGTHNTIDIDLSSLGSVANCNHKAFQVTAGGSLYSFVLTNDDKENYNGYPVPTKINIKGCSSLGAVANRISAAIKSRLGSSAFTIAVSGSKITLTTVEDGLSTNSRYDALGRLLSGSTEPPTPEIPAAPSTGLSMGKFTGGKDAVIEWEPQPPKPDPSDPDKLIPQPPKPVTKAPAVSAKFTLTDVNMVADGSGITLKYGSSKMGSIVFQAGSGAPKYDSATGRYTVGKDYNGTFSVGGVTFTMAGGSLTAVAPAGADGNRYSFSDGVDKIPSKPGISYTEADPLPGITNLRTGADGDKAHWDIDLSAYDTTDIDKADELIKAYAGKSIYFSMPVSRNYEFIDTTPGSGMDGVSKINNSYTIDLKAVRDKVKGGRTVAEAFAEVLQGGFSGRAEVVTDPSDPAKVTGVKLLAYSTGLAGNSEYVGVSTGDLRSYTIDWKNWVDTQGITNISAALDEKGFRFYCPTDPSQWVNVRFINGRADVEADKPDSGTEELDIKTVTIDIKGINTPEDLVKKIDTDLGTYLRDVYKHNLLLASDYESGTITIYDRRKHTVLDAPAYPNKQEKGAKIATGVMDNVVKVTRNVFVNDLVIQHTDKASVNIHIKIPQTTLNHIFGYKEGTHHISEYNVMTSEMREQLLGVPPEPGILDKGINYLTDAQTLIGAQINHMRHADNNIITQHENVTSSVSVIQDADMAKTAVEYAKYNLLNQTSQAMLAQANYTLQGVLSLLE